MPSRTELVAHGRDTDAIAEAIGADLVIFQTLPDLVASVRQFNPSLENFDCSVFTGDYVTGGVDEDYLAHLEDKRADNVKDRVPVGDVGTLEGKGGGGTETPTSNGDDTVGLHNTWNA